MGERPRPGRYRKNSRGCCRWAKIEERREGRSAAVNAAAAAEARLRERAAPLMGALTAMVARLSRDPMFANAVGRPEVTFRCDDPLAGEGYVTFEGPVGILLFSLGEGVRIWLRITLVGAARSARECGSGAHTDSQRVSGQLDRLDEFVARVEDHIAELLADLYLSPAAHLVLGTGQQRGITGGW